MDNQPGVSSLTMAILSARSDGTPDNEFIYITSYRFPTQSLQEYHVFQRPSHKMPIRCPERPLCFPPEIAL